MMAHLLFNQKRKRTPIPLWTPTYDTEITIGFEEANDKCD